MNVDTDAAVKTAINMCQRLHRVTPNITTRSDMAKTVGKYATELREQRDSGHASSDDLLPTLMILVKYSNVLEAGAEIFICGYEDKANIYAYHLVNTSIVEHRVKKY